MDPLLTALPIPVLVTDAGDRIVDANPAVERLLGESLAALSGRAYTDLLLTEEDSDEPPPSGRVSAGDVRDVRLLRRDGKIIWGRVELATVDGRHVRTIVDVSEDKRAQEQLVAKARAFERSNRDLDEFAAVASHDLQEPLRKIRTFGERLATRYAGVLGEDGVDYVGRMQTAATRMQALIEDLLAFSRVSWDTEPFARVNLRDVLRELLSVDLEATIEAAQGHVHVGALPTVEADPSQMHRLFLNLVANALKFRRPDVPPRVNIGAVLLEAWQGRGDGDLRGEAACEIIVSDNGIGFDPRHAERIFAPFRRLHGKGVYPGTGMGLAICRKIVERHRGTIVARAKPDRGAEFVVTLPVRQPHRPPDGS